MQSKATTVEQYLAELPDDRRETISIVRDVIAANVPQGVVEEMSYGMIGWVVPHSIYPKGYHCNPKLPLPMINLASQKNHMAIYLFCIYGDEVTKATFFDEYNKTGKKLDAGSSCVRFKKLADLPLELIGRTIKAIDLQEFVERYDSTIAKPKTKK